MKKDIHPDYTVTEVTCTCGAQFTTRSTASAGSMRLQSAEGEGTTVTLRFPRQHEPTDPSIQPPMAREEGILRRQPALD